MLPLKLFLLQVVALLELVYTHRQESDVPVEKYPYMLRIRYQNKDQMEHFCAGTLIRPNCVLTSAHCMIEAKLSSVRVYGMSSSNVLTHKSKVKLLEIPKDYGKERQDLDIALLGLDKGLPRAQFTGVQLDMEHVTANDVITMLGWTYTKPESAQFGGLRARATKHMRRKKCRKHLPKTMHNPNTSCLSDSYNWASSGQIDHGGPVLHNGRQIGIITPQGVNKTVLIYTSFGSNDVRLFLNSRIASFCDTW